MKKAILTTFIGLTTVSCAFAQSLTSAVPVHDQPVWQQVQSSPQAPGAPVAVRSLSTNQVIGAVPVDSAFLSFGTNGNIVTMAFNGQIGYVPATSVSRLHPTIPEQVAPPAGPDTLEDLAQQYEDRVNGQAEVSLKMTNSVVNTAPNASSITGQGAIPGGLGVVGGGGTGINPYAGQPGATLAAGGIPALGAMAGNPEYK